MSKEDASKSLGIKVNGIPYSFASTSALGTKDSDAAYP